ncbi:ATP-binding protein [bacterium]|nr:ATP-binding protein [bacterium]
MVIQRKKYLKQLISLMGSEMIKVVTGMRRSGKSYLLFKLFYNYLIKQGVKEEQIIKINLDEKENIPLRSIDNLYNEISNRIKYKNRHYYLLMDEVQYTIKKQDLKNKEKPLPIYDVLNSMLNRGNVDVYITGSNSKFLSSDVMTEFRGRGWPIHIQPLVFSEYYEACRKPFDQALDEYIMYGGLPYVLKLRSHEEKYQYLINLFGEVFLKDIKERYSVQNDSGMDELIEVLASSVGSLTNPKRISDTFNSKVRKISEPTVADYLQYLQDSFLVQKVKRYDIKGRKYIGTPSKYYFTDIGLRNAKLNFRQQDKNHIMENIIYNELIYRDYNVDVGIVPVNAVEKGKHLKKQYEVDFVANHINQRYYIQSALNVESKDKLAQEQKSLVNIPDAFKRVIVTEKTLLPWHTEEGTLVVGLKEFLLDKNIL